ncbi:type II toxin-antitoxin system prevent-host-death family antitoxin [Gaiella sp.]|uniref:type II toxin-antitoxin system Phd/YefM family antitoxin n=1 Tax=Gaiella sp. TaxID=2663207 RepID=UPI003267A05E
MRVEVGVRELRENLAEWLDRAAAGEEILVTERGQPKALLSAAESAWDRMIREGRITPPTGKPKPLPPLMKPVGEGPTMLDYLMWVRGRPWPGPGPEPGTEDDPV